MQTDIIKGFLFWLAPKLQSIWEKLDWVAANEVPLDSNLLRSTAEKPLSQLSSHKQTFQMALFSILDLSSVYWLWKHCNSSKELTILHKLTFCCQCGYGCGHWSCLSVVMFMVLRPMTMPNADGLRCQHWFTCWLEIIACEPRCFAGSGLLTWTCPAPSFKWAAFPSISRFDTETFKTFNMFKMFKMFKMLKSGWGGDEGQEEAAPTVLPSSHCTGLNILANILTNVLTNISNISSSSRFPCLPTYLLLLFYIQDSGGWMEEAAKTESEKQRAEPPDPG